MSAACRAALAALEPHPHAAAVLGAAAEGRPSHAYLLHGPAGSGKRAAARAVAAELLARGAADPAGARTRAEHGTHPDLTWVAPSGAHEMLRRDVDEAVVAAAARTPFEAAFRVFVLERADTMNDEAANALLKTLEEPADYVVLLLLTDRPTQVLPTIASRCQPVRFDAPSPEALAARLESRRAPPPSRPGPPRGSRSATASGRSRSPSATARRCAPAPRRSRAPRWPAATGAERPWLALLEAAAQRGAAARAAHEERLAEELQFLPRKEHKRRETEIGEQARRADRRAQTAALDHGLQLAGLWYRDLACVAAGVPELAHHADRAAELAADAEGRGLAAFHDGRRARRRRARPARAQRELRPRVRGARVPARAPASHA